MKKDLAILQFECQWLKGNRNFIGFFLFMIILSQIFLQIAIIGYKGKLSQVETFKKVEIGNFKSQTSLRGYTTQGFRVSYLPPPFKIYVWDAGDNSDIDALVDTSGKLNINHPLVKSPFAIINRIFSMDFAGMIYLFGTLLALFYGYETIRKIEFRKSQASIISSRRLFLAHIASRCIILSATLSLAILSGLLLPLLNGLPLPVNNLFLNLWINSIVIALFFFFTGLFLGSLRKRKLSNYSVSAVWITLFFVIPFTFQIAATVLSTLENSWNKHEEIKFRIVRDFDKNTDSVAGIMPFGQKVDEKRKILTNNFLKSGLKQIDQIENIQFKEIEMVISKRKAFMSWFPSSFFTSSLLEMSGKGYQGLLDFSLYIGEMNSGFFKFFIAEMYQSPDGSDFKEVKSFIKNDENVFRGKGTIMDGAWIFYCISFGCIMFLAFYSCKRFKMILIQENPGDTCLTKEEKIIIHRGESWNAVGSGNSFYTLFSTGIDSFRNMGYTHEVRVDGEPANTLIPGKEFIYICNPESLPCEINPRHLITLFGKLRGISSKELKTILETTSLTKGKWKFFSESGKKERGEVCLALLQMVEPGSIVVANDLAKDMPLSYVAEVLNLVEDLEEKNVSFINLCDEYLLKFNMPGNKSKGFGMKPFTDYSNFTDRYLDISEETDTDPDELKPKSNGDEDIDD